MLVVFEGIDGSGKTTLSNRVAAELRAAGLLVEHVREGGRLASDVAERMRDLGRDARNLALSPTAELLLLAAREAQILDEVTRPALGRAQVVIADRYLDSPFVLATRGRGLPAERVVRVLESLGAPLPDLAILVDVEPVIARARRRAAKLESPASRPGSRKGLSGAGLVARLREGYLEIAAHAPGRWIVVDNNDADLGSLTRSVTALVRTALREGAAGAIAEHAIRLDRTARPPRPIAPRSLGEARAAFLRAVDRRSDREPATAAYLLGGLAGPGFDERRAALANRAPRVVAAGLKGLDDELSWRLRGALAEVAPDDVARSVGGRCADADESWRIRAQLVEIAPFGVAASLDGLGSPRAFALRDRLLTSCFERVVASLGGLDQAEAWALRAAWLRGRPDLSDAGRAASACRSIAGLACDRAWSVRDESFAAAPAAALASLAGVFDAASWALRRRWVDRALKPVMESLDGSDLPEAWELRRHAGTRCKEAIDSLTGLDGAEAWAMREAHADRWPSTVVKSLKGVAPERAWELAARQLRTFPEDLSVLRNVSALGLDGPEPRPTLPEEP